MGVMPKVLHDRTYTETSVVDVSFVLIAKY